MVSTADRVPVVEGAKVTLKMQLAWAAREFPQALTTAKSPGETLAEMSVRATPPELVRVICCAVLVVPICCCAKLRAKVERVSVAGALPMPESCAVCVAAEGVPLLSVMESVAERAPLAVGEKTMEMEQAVEGARVAPQVSALMRKSVGSPRMTGVCSVAIVPPVLAT
ncbi:MAG TPA: hypothetical protein VIJ38_16250, partial [Acidobacteriaceae bacterium]